MGGADGSGGQPFVGPCVRDLVGDVTVETQADVDAIQDVCSIDGDLSLQAEVARIELSRLETVTGQVSIAFNSALAELHLPVLETLGEPGDEESGFLLGEAESLTRVELPALEEVSYINVFTAPSLTEFDLTSLARTQRIAFAATGLTELDLPALTEGNIDLNANDDIEMLHVPNWTSGSLLLWSGGKLTALDCPSLASAGAIELQDAANLTRVSFPVLESMSGTLRVDGLPALEELSFPALTTTQWVEVTSNDALVSASFSALESIADDWLEIADNPVLETLSVPALVLGAAAHVEENPALTTCEGAALVDVPDCQ